MEKPINFYEEESSSGEEKCRLFVKVIENTLHGIIITDNECNIIYVNPAFTKITGYHEEDVIGKNPRVLQSGRHDKAFYQQMWLSIQQTSQWHGELWNRRKNGKLYSELLNISALKNDIGEIINYVGVLFDITERKKLEQELLNFNQELQQLSATDFLTGIANRRSFNKQLEIEWRRAVRNSTPLSLIMLDIDFFKNYNDAYGHQKGDDCLKQVASVVQASLKRPQDLAARYGGEEFPVILPDTDGHGAAIIAREIQSKLALLQIPHVGSQISDYVTVSMGIASVTPDVSCISDQLLLQADQALYAAKQSGRNQIVHARELSD